MRKYSAEEKLNKIEFNSYEDWGTYPLADYTCEKCKQVISIDFNSLTKHQFSDFSNFTENDKEAFQTYAILHELPKTNSFLDFYCPGCKHPVHIHYDSWAGGRHGESGYSIKYVVA